MMLDGWYRTGGLVTHRLDSWKFGSPANYRSVCGSARVRVDEAQDRREDAGTRRRCRRCLAVSETKGKA